MDFSEALRHLKRGNAVHRFGWNGKGMFLFIVDNREEPVARQHPLAKTMPVGTMAGYTRHVAMKTADGTIVPWLCSQTDMLADDWQLYWEPEE